MENRCYGVIPDYEKPCQLNRERVGDCTDDGECVIRKLANNEDD